MRCLKLLLLLLFLGFGLSTLLSAPPDRQDRSKNSGKNRQEAGLGQYFKKWLDEDVSYIITDDEKSVFKSLKNDEERESFIEQFWNRRNPDPGSSYNSFKEEHYRRIAYANEHFASGIPGWRTDRGRIYIMYGKPDELETHPMGGSYDRPIYEGGGTTSTFPFEKWFYRHIEGVGEGVEIEFVDSTMSGEYRLAMGPDDKDALINVPDAGLKLAEAMGLANKSDRTIFNLGSQNNPYSSDNVYKRAQDMPFARMEQFFAIQRAPEIKFKDLRTAVETHISYESLTYDLKTDCLKLTSDKVLVPVTIEINNSELQFKREEDFNRAKLNIYGRITSITGRLAAEWEDVVTRDFNDILYPIGKNKTSEYQKIIALAPGMPYRLDLVLQDLNSKKMGTTSKGLNIPKYNDNELQSSTIILADTITPAPMNVNQLDQYVIGDMRIVPLVKHEYTTSQYLVPYMQIYNMQVDQTSQKPLLDISFLLKRDGKLVEEFKNTAFNSEQYFYGQRVVLVGKIPLKNIPPGKYTLEIQVQDRIANRSLSTSTDFKVKESKPIISSAIP